MKKKLMAIVLTVGVVLSLVGCGGETTSNEVSQVEETVAEATVEETTEEVVEQAEEVATPEPTAEPTPGPTQSEIELDAFAMISEVNNVVEELIANGKGYASSITYISAGEQDTSTHFHYNDMYASTHGTEVDFDSFKIIDTVNSREYFMVDGTWCHSSEKYQTWYYQAARTCWAFTMLNDENHLLEVYAVDPITGEELDDYIFTQLAKIEDANGATVTVLSKLAVDKETMLPKVMVMEWYDGEATIEQTEFEVTGEMAFREREEYSFEYFDETSENWEEFTSLFVIPEESIDYDALVAEW